MTCFQKASIPHLNRRKELKRTKKGLTKIIELWWNGLKRALFFLSRKEMMSEKFRLLLINQKMGQRFVVLILPLNGRDLR